MRYLKFFAVAFATAFISGEGFAQTSVVEDFKITPTTQEGKQSPQVNSERRVRVSISAPDAKKVQLDIDAVKYDLTKDENGVWTGESAPQDVGFHYYQLNIDGASVPDPESLYFFGASRWGSGIEVPSDDQDFFALKNVPHGDLRETYYFSKASNSNRRVFIYTPPGYNEGNEKYPVLYLQHGMGENETGWGSQGHANFIMDNLIAEGKAVPFIIVMENSAISFGGGPRPPRPPAAERPVAAPGQDAPQGPPSTGGEAGAPRRGFGGPGGFNFAGQFERVLIDDLIPFIESNYRVIGDQEHRAMAGLSMGGMQTKSIVMANPNLFSHIGMFSSGTFMPNEIKDIESFKKSVELVFMSFGGKEGGASRIGDAAKEWDKVGIKGVSYVSPETAHEWHSWRRSLYEFAPLIFK